MQKAKHHFLVHPFFKWYAKYIIRKDFETVRIIGELATKNSPILLISNHMSWWDGFWAMYINLTVLHRKFHFFMLEEQLRKYWFFNYTGGFSINKKSKDMIESLNYAKTLLKDPQNMLLIFPQGGIQSMHNQPIQFEKGLERILKNTENEIQIVFLVNLVDYFSKRKPSIYFYIHEYQEAALDVASIQNSYNSFYKASVKQQQDSINP